MIELLEIMGLCPGALREGFSAYRTGLSASASTPLTNWTVTPPYFSSTNFTATSGVYTVPETGVYAITATVNYTASAISVSLNSGINPAFVVQRTSPTSADLIRGLLPIVNLSLVVTVRGVLGGGAVTLSGAVLLSKEDQVQLYYDADGMTLSLQLQDIVWSVYQLC